MRATIAAAVLVLASNATCFAQGLSLDPNLKRSLDQALQPLKTLNSDQMKAVAVLVAADRARVMDIENYCPPLKALAVKSRIPCLDQIASYAQAEKECKRQNPRDCPKLKIAESAMVACEVQRLMADLGKLNVPVVSQGPQPGPQLGPRPGPGPDPQPRKP